MIFWKMTFEALSLWWNEI